MIKAIIFDSDGVVTSSKIFSEELEKDFGISAKRLMPFFKSVFQKCLVGEADLKIELKNYIDEWGWRGSVDELADYWFKAEHEINERIVQKIKELKQNGIKCYLGTNQEQYRTDYMRKSMGFGDLFDAIYSSAEIGIKKPKQEFFNVVYKQINEDGKILKNEIMFWDDDSENVKSAKKFGFQANLYCNFTEFEKNVSLK